MADLRTSRELEREADELLARNTPKKKKRNGKLRYRAAAAVGVLQPAGTARVESTTTVHRRHKSFRKK